MSHKEIEAARLTVTHSLPLSIAKLPSKSNTRVVLPKSLGITRFCSTANNILL